jgi:hypothetical protein
MIETLIIGNEHVDLRADGATPFLYKQAFSKDLLKIFSEASATEDVAVASEMAAELGFVMAQQAKSPDPLKVDLSRGAFMLWLTKFEPLDLTNSALDIIGVYLSNYKTDSSAKKKDEPQTEK